MFAADSLAADPDAYVAIAQTLSQTGIFGIVDAAGQPRATAFRPPLYPWLLSWLIIDGQLSRLAVAALHVLLAVVTSCFVVQTIRRLAERFGSDPDPERTDRLAIIAAVLVAIDPILVRQSMLVMTETLAALLASVVVWVWSGWSHSFRTRRNVWFAIGLGLVLTLAYFCRPTFLVWGGLLILAMMLRTPSLRGVLFALSTSTVILVGVAGWIWRNDKAIGYPAWATTHGGYTLLLANNDLLYDHLREGNVRQTWDATAFLAAYAHRYDSDPRDAEFWKRDWTDVPVRSTEVPESVDDQIVQEAAIASIRRNPFMFVWSSVVRVGRLWSPFPHRVTGRSLGGIIFVSVYYMLMWIAIGWAVLRHRSRLFTHRWWAIWLLAVALTVVHAVYWSNLRMRAPVMPSLAIVAVFSLRPKEDQ